MARLGEEEWLAILRQHYAYDADTGILSRNGRCVGRLSARGYIRINFRSHSIQAHRAAWLLTHGHIPDGCIVDHKNRDRADNRLVNLRAITVAENNQNRITPSRSNKLGLIGVFIKRGKYRAEIGLNGRMITIGTFDTAEEASAAYARAKRQFHPAYTE